MQKPATLPNGTSVYRSGGRPLVTVNAARGSHILVHIMEHVRGRFGVCSEMIPQTKQHTETGKAGLVSLNDWRFWRSKMLCYGFCRG